MSKITIKSINGELIIDGEYEDTKDAVEHNKNNLRYADLRYANLRNADLSFAVLSDANLRNADLRGDNLCGAKGINKNAVCQLNFLHDQVGKIRLYKLVNDKYESPMHCSRLTYKIGKPISVDNANTDDTVLCSAGINVATLDWCIKEWRAGWRILIVEFTADDISCIPIATDGKIRLHRCTVVGEKDLVEIGLIKSEEASDE